MSQPPVIARKSDPLTRVGIFILSVGLLTILYIFFPAAKEEVKYHVVRNGRNVPETVEPVNKDFSIQINKLGANAPIVVDVDATDSQVYQRALTRGVAHARGTGLPGEGKNIFLFAHSSATYLLATRYNSIFYLLHKLEIGDEIEIWYKEQHYSYHVKALNYVPSTSTSYLGNGNSETLSLMTCWPPGTTLKRLIVIAD